MNPLNLGSQSEQRRSGALRAFMGDLDDLK